MESVTHTSSLVRRVRDRDDDDDDDLVVLSAATRIRRIQLMTLLPSSPPPPSSSDGFLIRMSCLSWRESERGREGGAISDAPPRPKSFKRHRHCLREVGGEEERRE